MKAIVRHGYGGPEQLRIEDVADPAPDKGEVLVQVRAFGLNRAEQYFRLGLWGDVAPISGIECVGTVGLDPSGRLLPGQKVLALMGGLGRSRSGSYAERVTVPMQNVVPVRTSLDWETLAAIPESYATAWSCLHDNLGIRRGDRILVRGASSALGQAAVQLATLAGAEVIASVRSPQREPTVRALGAKWTLREGALLEAGLGEIAPKGVDAVLDLVGTTTVLQSLRLARRGARVCLAGFLGGAEPLASLDPLRDLPSGRHLSFFGSAFVYGTPDYPLTDIPFQRLVELAEDGQLQVRPARVYEFHRIQDAHRMLDAEGAGGKIVVTLPPV
jgi:NADPH:quinone reductase-like Zn-dependent oxidoreductase